MVTTSQKPMSFANLATGHSQGRLPLHWTCSLYKQQKNLGNRKLIAWLAVINWCLRQGRQKGVSFQCYWCCMDVAQCNIVWSRAWADALSILLVSGDMSSVCHTDPQSLNALHWGCAGEIHHICRIGCFLFWRKFDWLILYVCVHVPVGKLHTK